MPLYNDLEVRPSVRLEPTDQMDMSTLALEAAKAGALGAPVAAGALGAGRAMVSYEDWLNTQPKVRGRFSEDEIEDLRAIAKKHDTLSRRMPPGYGLEGEFRYFPYSPIKRTGKADWRTKQGPKARVNVEYKGKRRGEAAIRALQDELESSGYTAKPGKSIQGKAPIISAQPRETRFKPSTRAKAAQFLKGAAKEAFSLKNILTDAAIGSTFGAVSALGGHYAGGGSRESAGLFTPPGEGYEGLVRAEDIERVIAQKELEKEAERQRLLRQYEASGYDIDPNTRLSELR